MKREDLEHIIRAAADITNEYEFVVVGSQSILGPIPNPPAVFTMSAEADIYPLMCTAISRVDDMPIETAAQGRLRARIKRWTKALRDQGHAVPDGDA
jgi:hypothetical protein